MWATRFSVFDAVVAIVLAGFVDREAEVSKVVFGCGVWAIRCFKELSFCSCCFDEFPDTAGEVPDVEV